MSLPAFAESLRRLWALEKFTYSLRVFIALSGVMAGCWLTDQIALVIPLFLGVIASALAETDDSWLGRIRASGVTLVCFAVAAFAVKLLMPYPLLFVAGLALSTFVLTLFGALGDRYATLGQATLILSVYTMIGVDQGKMTTTFWHEPLLLTLGASWYSLLSVIWHALFAHQPVQQGLATLFVELSSYLKIKATLLEPVKELDIEERRLALARQNGRVVAALNLVKETILSRMDGSGGQKVNRYLRLYFIAQDIHERASSSHYPYHQLSKTFFHSDVLFRCQRLLDQQGKACKRLAFAIRLRKPFDYGDTRQAHTDLQASLTYLQEQQRPEWRRLLRSLNALADNLASLEQRLATTNNPDALASDQDSVLFDHNPRTLKQAWQRLRQHLSVTSLLFRHALRLSIALCIGYGVLHAIHPSQGYWILLTTVFVCQPNYGATRIRLGQRVGGTVVGLIAGWALITLFPSPLIQSLIAVVAGVSFFVTRKSQYALATGFITLMVVCCFNQVGNGYGLIWPRLVDTVLGTLIAGLAVFTILPDWQGRQLHRVVANVLDCNGRFLRQLMQQYATGKKDDLDYRVARRDAHNADAALSTALSNMRLEPGHFRKDAEVCFPVLVVSHTLLSYLSALGAHRHVLQDVAGDEVLDQAAEVIVSQLQRMAEDLAERRPVTPAQPDEQATLLALEQLADGLDDQHRLVQTQLLLISQQLAPLRERLQEMQQRVASAAPALTEQK